MLLKRTVKIVALSAAASMAISTVATFAVIRHLHKRRQRKGGFLSNKKRQTITDFLEVAAKDIPHGPLGASVYRNHLQAMSDKRLLVLYAAVKIGEYVRDSGIDPTQITAEQLEAVRQRFTRAEAEGARDREGLLSSLLSHDVSDLKPLLIAALGVLVLI